MKGKYIFIFLLLALLIFTVEKMMRFETHLREERQVKLYVEDESKPLFSKAPDEEIAFAATNSDYYFKTEGDYFKNLAVHYREEEKQYLWDDIFFKGVNLGVAVPGKFPAEFSLSFDEYLEWITLIGQMNANIIRLYTILPPAFYDAFLHYNLIYADKPVYLMQGVWVEVPASENYYNADFIREFEKEIIDAVDVIHGNAVLRPKPGKAHGVYASNVSKYVAAILLGREWEPASVFKTNKENKTDHYHGDFITMNKGNAMEAWLARMMDFTVLYETQQYRFQHPVSFVNWLPLDPMYHNTEIIENNRVKEYDNDLESIDFERFYTTGIFYPGIYAAYHVYPYYPDFTYLQESYINPKDADSSRGAYFHYLKDLKRHNRNMPLVIAEYGLPSSRGNSHVTPFGFDQGGHSEEEQAVLSLSLTRDITDASCAGAIYFEWIDEWFKHNWLVMDFEQPEDDRKLWHNMENPEQNFGIMALENKIHVIDGDLSDWDTPHAKNKPSFDADATYFYISSALQDFSFETNNLYIAIDTYDKEKGDHRLPFSTAYFENGFEFLVRLNSVDSSFILVDEPYSVFTDIYNDYIPAYASQYNENGRFIHQFMMTNRSRTSLGGIKTDSVIVDRGRLEFGISSDPATSNADWYFDEPSGALELRLDWHLLNVTDPAKLFVLDDRKETRAIDYTETDAFRILVFITDKQDKVIGRHPTEGTYSYIWESWDMPSFTSRLKPIYDSLKVYFKHLQVEDYSRMEEKSYEESFRITDFYENRPAAFSISFDNASYSQYQHALPLLEKYGYRATFGIVPAILDAAPRVQELAGEGPLKRLGVMEMKEIAAKHEIALQALPGDEVSDKDFLLLGEKAGKTVETLHWTDRESRVPSLHSTVFLRKSDGVQATGWTILSFRHLYENLNEISQQVSPETIRNRFISKSDFEWEIRALRNNGCWIAPETEVYKYLKEKESSSVRIEKYQNIIFLKAVNRLDPAIFNVPLTIEFTSDAPRIRISGSESDGEYTARNGHYYFDVLPNKEIVIELKP